jgi:peptide-methionine (S)-S-oxide reductase
MNARLLKLFGCLTLFTACQPNDVMTATDKQAAPQPEIPAGAQVATLGAGCFWCIDAAYRQFDGVYSATSGYMGGEVENPTYEQICGGDTGHAEVVQVVFDPQKISYEKVLAWFWDLHDPTTLNRQGNDTGTQYRSAIFTHSPEQITTATASKSAAQANFNRPIVTEITPADVFYPAENYHQNYYNENKSKNSYCRYVVEPKLKKLKLDH